MRQLGIAVLALAATAFVTACGSGSIGQSPTVAPTPVVKAVPDFLGKGLQTAQDDAQAQGFHNLVSHDASGRGRVQIIDRDWKVCFQAPAAGTTASSSSRLAFGVVKLDETCPATDQGAVAPTPVAEGQAMPDLVGRSLNAAFNALPPSTSITPRDVSGQGRLVIVPTNWKVCSQVPRPGARFTGQPVAFGVVKYGEPCP